MRSGSTLETWRPCRPLDLIAMACLMMGTPALGDAVDPDARLVGEYVLTVDKLTHFIAASTALGKAAETDASLKAEIDRMADEPDDTIAEMKATLGAHPRIAGFYAREGLAIDDAVLLPLAAENALASADPSPPPDEQLYVSPQQKQFAQEHLKELKALSPGAGESQD